MNKKEQHIMTGMTRDMSANRFNANFACDARNIRITAREGNSTLLAVTNEKGTAKFTVTGDNIIGIVIGTAVLNDTLVLFTTQSQDTPTQAGTTGDYIYKLVFSEDYTEAECTKLFGGSLGFCAKSPLETLPFYENVQIQKVYWVDGINQPRVINIANGLQTNPDVFNFLRTVDTDNLNFEITKFNYGGQFTPGTIQYCFAYFNKFGQETPIIEASPLYLLSPKERGLAADGQDVSSFQIKLSGLDSNFEYVRVYSIVRSSEGATPVVKNLGDFKITSDRKVTLTDTGTKGSTLEPTALLFLGGQNIIAQTLATKDNTLFLGNIEIKKQNIGDLRIGGGSGDTIKEYCHPSNRHITINSHLFEETPPTHASGETFYDYPIDNNRPSDNSKWFKSGENYRLGFVAQDENGNWSEVIWLGDVEETQMPVRLNPSWDTDNQTRVITNEYKNCGFKAEIPSEVVQALKDNGFQRIAPVAVYPKGIDRQVICQGILAGTVFNVSDRIDNSPFVQPDWRFRPGYVTDRIDKEVQTCAWNDAPICPGGEVNGVQITKENFQDFFKEYFYRDSTFITFHSPDVEYTDDIIEDDFKNAALRIVGVSNGGFRVNSPFAKFPLYATSVILQASPGWEIWAETLVDPAAVQPKQPFRDFLEDFYGYHDTQVTTVNGHKYSNGYFKTYRNNYKIEYQTYLWHRHGSLNNQPELTTTDEEDGITRTALLKHKIMAELQYAKTTFLSPNKKKVVNCAVLALQDSNKVLSKLSIGSKQLVYYGEIDKILTPNLVDTTNFSGEEDYTECDFGGEDKTSGYPIGYKSYWRASADSSWTHVTGEPYPASAGSRGDPANNQTGILRGTDPVYMKYSTQRHLIIGLWDGGDALWTFDKFLGERWTFAHTMFWFNDFWDGRPGPAIETTYVGLSSSDLPGDGHFDPENSLYIAELYRTFTEDQQKARFGGNSDEALAQNDWVMCGKPVSITGIVQNTTPIEFTEGDTFVARYDCLKAYPTTQEDENSVVSIYSTEIESRVNLDARYDKNRGLLDNTLVTPQNFNLFNRPGYEQTRQYFTYHSLDYDRYKKLQYPNMLTWSLEKTPGEDVDLWTQINLTSTLDLDGDKGGITALTSFRNEVFAFQNRGFAQLLYNSRVQIPTSDGQPIEITNGLKMSGKRYISDQIGVTNKWSIKTTPNGLYFIDDEKNNLYQFNEGLMDLSTKNGLSTWFNAQNSYTVWNPVDYGNIRTFYDKVNGDLYFATKDEALVYSELLGNFISFMDYGNLPAIVNVNDKLFAFTQPDEELTTSTMWEMWAGEYNSFFGEVKPYWITFIANADPSVDKVFNNLEWRTMTYRDADDATGVLQPDETFDTLRVWHNHQDTSYVPLVNTPGKPSILKKKFNVFRTFVPRDVDVRGFSRPGKDRIRNTWAYVKLAKYHPDNEFLIFTDIQIDYFE